MVTGYEAVLRQLVPPPAKAKTFVKEVRRISEKIVEQLR
jgi:hypothetical protein